MRHRRGVTLIELLIVIAIMTVIATMIIAVAPRFGERQRATRGAGMLQSWLNLAKQRAVRDQRPVGIRIPSIAGSYVTELMYVELPGEDDLGGVIKIPYQVPASGPTDWTQIQFVSPFDFNPATDPAAAVLPGDVINFLNRPLGQYQPRRIVAIARVAARTFQVKLDQALPAIQFQSQPGDRSFLFARKARPVVGEPVLQMPKDIAVDVSREVTAPNVPPSWYRMFPKLGNTGGSNPFDIVFSPAGQVVGFEGNLGSRICLWVRDVSLGDPGPTVLPPGENMLITIYTRTGHVTAHPVDPAGLVPGATTWNPFKFTQDGLSSGQ